MTSQGEDRPEMLSDRLGYPRERGDNDWQRIRAALEVEADAYRWLPTGRVCTDPDLAATVARLFDECEQQRRRAETAELALLAQELRCHNQPADDGDAR